MRTAGVLEDGSGHGGMPAELRTAQAQALALAHALPQALALAQGTPLPLEL